MISKDEVTEYLVWLGVIGTYVFSWGVANYRKIRAVRREENLADQRLQARFLADKISEELGDD